MESEVVGIVMVVAWLSSGLAAVALVPRNLAARALCAAGLLGATEWLVQPIAEDHRLHAIGALLPVLCYMCVLGAVTSFAVIASTYPRGVFERSWHRVLVRVLMVLSVAAPVAMLVGSPTVIVNGDSTTERPDVLALPALGLLGHVGTAISGADPFFGVAGLVLLALRWRAAGRSQRAELRPLVAGIALIGLLLLVLVVAIVADRPLPQPWFQAVFLLGMALLPVVLLAGLSRRTRGMDAELTASRTRLIAAEDKARRRIERDLHDGVQQQLVAILSLTQLAVRQLRRDPHEVVGTLDDVHAQVTTAITDLREVVSGIRPPVLEDAGVVAALESRLARTGAEVTLDVAAVRDVRWPPEVEAAAYFVVCEAVTNALKHAPGSPVRVRLGRDGDDLDVRVEDTGPGVADPWPAGRGLSGLRDRVDSLGGTFAVDGRDGGGTAVRASFPAASSRARPQVGSA